LKKWGLLAVVLLVTMLFASVVFAGVSHSGNVRVTNTSSGDAIDPDFYVDDSDNTQLVWQNNVSGNSTVYYVKLNSTITSPSSNITPYKSYSADDARSPVIGSVGSNSTVLWEEFDTSSAKYYIPYVITSSVGAVLVAKTAVSNINYSSYSPDIITERGSAHSVWRSVINSTHRVVYRKLVDGIWSEPFNVSINNSNASQPSISAHSSNIYVAWSDTRNNSDQIYLRMYKGNQINTQSVHDSDGDNLVDILEKGWTNNSNSSYNDADPATTTNISAYDTDNDGLPDGWVDGWVYDARNNTWKRDITKADSLLQSWEGEDLNLNGRVDAGETSPNNPDNDSDGLPDGFESWYSLDPLSAAGANGASGNPDNDNLTNIQEYTYHTNPKVNDTDGDGLNDYYELFVSHTDPWLNDSDYDGLNDNVEITLGTNALVNDSDHDGVMDGFEMYETQNYEENAGPGVDSDNDGLINAKDNDSDNDGISDGFEFKNSTNKLAPVLNDTDGDGLLDGAEDADHDGVQDASETDAWNPDSDGDGLWDGNFTVKWTDNGWTTFNLGERTTPTDALDPDTDNDGLSDATEVFGWQILINGKVYTVTSHPQFSDTDADLISDYDEYDNKTNPSASDTDSDGKTDRYEELTSHTSPVESDSDHDGVYDGVELTRGTDPLNSDYDSDGLPDSEGDWITFRTNATDVNGATVLRDLFVGDGYYHDLTYAASSISSVLLNKSGNFVDVTLSYLNSSSLGETQYNYKEGHMNTGYFYTGHNLTDDENVSLWFLADYAGGPYTTAYTMVNGPGKNFSIYGIVGVINATLIKASIVQTSLARTYDTMLLNESNYYYDSSAKEIITGHSLTGSSETLDVSYSGSGIIDYADRGNDNSWVALDLDSDLSQDLVPYGRVEGLLVPAFTTSDTYYGDYHSINMTTHEGYAVEYTRHDVVYPAKKESSAAQVMSTVAWRPQGDYAIVAGAGGAGYSVFKLGRNNSIVKFSNIDHINKVAWDMDGNYSILVGDSGLVLLYNSSANNLTQLNPGTSANLRGVLFGQEDWVRNYSVIVGDGVILRLNTVTWQFTNITLGGTGLGSSSYNYTDIAHIDSAYALMTTAGAVADQGKAFIFSWNPIGGASLYRAFTLSSTLSNKPALLTAASWRRGRDSGSSNSTDLGLVVGGIENPPWGYKPKLYACDWSGNCAMYDLPYVAGNMVYDVEWNPKKSEALIAIADGGDDGALVKWDANTRNVKTVADTDTKMYGIGWHPSGDYASIASRSNAGASVVGDTIVWNYLKPNVVISVPGGNNPIFMGIETTSGSFAYYADTGHGTIPAYNSSGQEVRFSYINTSPFIASSLDDGMLDGERVTLGFLDADYDYISNFQERDADNDGILNGEEAFPLQDSDNDHQINALDADSDGDGTNDTYEVKVVFRTDDRTYSSGSHVGVETNYSTASLTAYACGTPVAMNSSGLTRPFFKQVSQNISLRTPEGYPVYKNSTTIYIDISGATMVPCVPGAGISTSRTMSPSDSAAHKEVYDGTDMITNGAKNDTDSDGLVDLIDPNPAIADSDGDGLKDGFEVDWNKSLADDDGLRNFEDVDSDNDGLPDGWIDGWCYNATLAANHTHANGTIDGWGIYCSTDSAVQGWEGEDLNLDGGQYWQTKYTAEGEVRQTETNNQWPDTDVDGLLDGEEYVNNMNPLGGKDYDNDGIFDKDELKSYFMADSAILEDYAPGNSYLVERWTGFRYVNDVNLLGALNILKPTVTLPYEGHYVFNLSGYDLVGTLWVNITWNDTSIFYGQVTLNESNRTIYEGDIEGGIYSVELGPSLDGLELYKLSVFLLGSNWNDSDTDDDGVTDGKEEGWGRGISQGRKGDGTTFYIDYPLFGSSPLDYDTDGDGLSDGDEKDTSPTDPDSDGDKITDSYDLMPSSSLEFGNPWKDVFSPGTLYYQTDYYMWSLDGNTYETDCSASVLGACYNEHVDNRGNEGVLDSPDDDDTRKKTIEDVLNPGYCDEGLDCWHDSKKLYEVADLSLGFVDSVGNNRSIYSTSWSGWYYDTIDPYPKFEIVYQVVGKAYTATLINARNAMLVDGYGWVPLTNASLVDSISDDDKYVYAVQQLAVDVNKNNHITLQIEIDPSYDKMNHTDPYDYVLPAMEYRLYQGAFYWNSGVMSSFSIGKPLEILPGRHTYTFVMDLPKSKLTGSNYILYLSPMYLHVNSSGVTRSPLNKNYFTTGALVRTVDDYSFTLIANISKNISAIEQALPSDLSSYNGSYTFSGYKVFVYRGDSIGYSPSVVESHFSTSDAIVLYSNSDLDVSYMLSNTTMPVGWYFNYTNVWNMTLPSYSMVKDSHKTNYNYKYFQNIAFQMNLTDLVYSNKTSSYIGVDRYASTDVNKRNFGITKNEMERDYAKGLTDVYVEKQHSAKENVNSINFSYYVDPDTYANGIDDLENMKENSTATLTDKETFIIDMTIGAATFDMYAMRIGNGVAGFVSYWGGGYNWFKVGNSVRSVRSTLKDLNLGGKTLGEVQDGFAVANTAGKSMKMGFGDCAGIALDTAMLSYQMYQASVAPDAISRRAAYEGMVGSGIGLGLSFAAIAFPPAALIQPVWTLTYYAIWGPLFLLDKLGVIEVDQGAFGSLAKNVESIIVPFEMNFGIVPSFAAQDALENAGITLSNMYHSWYDPYFVIQPQ